MYQEVQVVSEGRIEKKKYEGVWYVYLKICIYICLYAFIYNMYYIRFMFTYTHKYGVYV